MGRDVTAAWRYPGFRRPFRMITVAWGIAAASAGT
jgi:hypothetical protein